MEDVQEDLFLSPVRCSKPKDKKAAFVDRRKRVILLVLSRASQKPGSLAHFGPHSECLLMLYLHKEDVVESRMDESRLWGEERNGRGHGRIKGKGGFFCLGRYVGSEKGKKTYPSFIVN